MAKTSELSFISYLRHANVSTTTTYYIKTAANDVRNALAKLESSIPAQKAEIAQRSDTVSEPQQTVRDTLGHLTFDSTASPATVN